MTEAEDLSTYCRDNCGLDVSTVALRAGLPRRTLYDWWRTRRRVVELIVKGTVANSRW